MAELLTTVLPKTQKKKLPRVIPIFRLGQLVPDCETNVNNEVGLVVDGKPKAIAFYLRHCFEQMLDYALKLFLPY